MDALLVFGLPMDLNRASVDALTTIPGIGEVRARAIVDEREQHGFFEDVSDLERVVGIGPATVDKLRPFLTASPPGR